MDQTQLLDDLRKIVRTFTNTDIAITPATVLRSDLGLNSYELVQLVCAIEDQYNVEIPDRTISRLRTAQDLLDFLAPNG